MSADPLKETSLDIEPESDNDLDDPLADLPEGLESGFLPSQPDYIIRQQQIATYQMLCQFLIHKDKNVAEVLDDVRVSIDCLTKCVLQLTKKLGNMTEMDNSSESKPKIKTQTKKE